LRIASLLLVNIEVNNLINSKKVFGVVYTCLLSCSLNKSQKWLVYENEYGINKLTASLVLSSPSSTSAKNDFETFNNASYGQG